MIRQIEWNKKICDLFGNVPGIELRYCGEGNTEELKIIVKSIVILFSQVDIQLIKFPHL